MANWYGFDINTSVDVKPWGPREETYVKEAIETLVKDTIGGTKRTAGHLHNKLYNNITLEAAVEVYRDVSEDYLDLSPYTHEHVIRMCLPDEKESGLLVGVEDLYAATAVINVDTRTGYKTTNVRGHGAVHPTLFCGDSNLYTRGPWIDYSSTSTVVGWSSTSVLKILYKTIGRLAFVKFNITGTSDSTYASFSVPFVPEMASAGGLESLGLISGINNGSPGITDVIWGNNVINFVNGIMAAYSSWTASGTKTISGFLTMEIEDAEF